MTGIHHVGLVARDAARTLAFYRGLLGLSEAGRTREAAEGGAELLWLGGESGRPGSLLAVAERPGWRKGGWGVGGVHHVALGVADRAALLKWKRWLEDRGVPVSGPYDRGYFQSIYFADPDGQILELATQGPGYAVDEPADALGRLERVPPGAELKGERDEAEIRRRTHPEPVERIGPDMRLLGIHHVSGITDDLERAHAFLESALGLRRVKRSVNQDHRATPHHFWAGYDGREVAPNSSYTLFGWAGSEYRAREGVGQTSHVAFRAADAEELGAWRERLLGLGVEAGPVEDDGVFPGFAFRAPDGQLLRLAADGPGFAVEGSAAGAGSAAA